MKQKQVAQFILLFALLCIGTLASANAQAVPTSNAGESGKTLELPARIDVTPDVQHAFEDASQAVSSVEEVAQLRRENAQLKQKIVVLQARLIYHVPDDYEAHVDAQGRLYFEKPKAEATPPGGANAPPPGKKP